MKTTITRLTNVTALPDGSLRIGYASSKDTHTLEIKPEALQQLYIPLLASRANDLNSPLSKKIHPAGFRRFQFGKDIGISFLIAQDVSLHLVFDRNLAQALQKAIETFDDRSTWNTVPPAAQQPVAPGSAGGTGGVQSVDQ